MRIIAATFKFSYRYIRVAVLETEVVGLVTLIPAVGLNEQRDYAEVLSRWSRWRVEGVQRLLRDRLLRHDYPDTAAYIGNLAVQPSHRNQGIGTQILQTCIAEAHRAGW